ncbi:hypothetical protein H8356DRAFT_1314377 [Neocallimastix lanati (nom. inval.)]|uniref:BTB domain-containing protein n=1 Tax=Neocallimastix californiae TaxID=1754190 RepID=A0A1Y2ATK0_9FUNG|nr:hypothetical protein H8356DRAFT_1314377 [Neocallimastix sp. JGI-2020a]ORY25893.1 hypothetical protein LY90DRAFT_629555 [Neocallimastix californiae]|eukprot:ORY25893.1 hypothetical protein LY90DRAFT_629555 [Neocallimastix californiae]
MSNQSVVQLPSPPSSPFFNNATINECNTSTKENKKLINIETILGTPEETHIEIDKDEILRRKFINIIEEGIQNDDEITPYGYFIQKLYDIGNKIINKRTKDAIPLRVYQIGNDSFQEFWVHPVYLSLQSFQFYKLFDEVSRNKEDGVIEIEVPSLETFPVILYWLYTGDQDKVLEIGKVDETLCKGIMDNIQYLEINIPSF